MKKTIGPLPNSTNMQVQGLNSGDIPNRHTQWQGPPSTGETMIPPDPASKLAEFTELCPNTVSQLDMENGHVAKCFMICPLNEHQMPRKIKSALGLMLHKKCVFASKHLCHVLIRNHEGRYVSIGIPFDHHISNIFYHEFCDTECTESLFPYAQTFRFRFLRKAVFRSLYMRQYYILSQI